MNLALEALGLRRSFGKKGNSIRAVDGVDLSIPEGQVLGIVGPDGAGKTTLIRMLVGVLRAESGTISICGHDLVKEREATRLLLGYMSQAFGLYEDLTISENIRFFAGLRRVPRALRSEREKRLLDFTRLAPFTGRRAGALSGGMKQKLGLICTLIHDPRVLFLDEPTNGVDPVSRREFWDILGELRGRVTVVVATPYMDEADRCDRVALMAEGRFLALAPPDVLKKRVLSPVWEVELDQPFAAAEALSQALPKADVQLFGELLHVIGPPSSQVVDEALARLGFHCRVAQIPPSMEDAFVQISTGQPGQSGSAS